MSAINPRYIKQLNPATDTTTHSLTDAEYANFLLIQPLAALAGYEILLESTGLVVMNTVGEILYGKI